MHGEQSQSAVAVKKQLESLGFVTSSADDMVREIIHIPSGQVDDPLPKKLRDRVAALLARRNSCKEFGAGTSLGLAVHGGGKITPKLLTESVRNAVFWLRQPHTKNCSVESDVACYQLDKNIDS